MAEQDDLFASFMNEIETVEKQVQQNTTQPSQQESNAADLPTGQAAAPQIMGGDDDDADELYLAERAERRAEELESIPGTTPHEIASVLLVYGCHIAEVHVTTTQSLLPQVDHSSISYEDFKRNFYVPHPAVAKLTPAQVAAHRKELKVTVTGSSVPAPLSSFMQAGLGDAVLSAIAKAGFTSPTPIQAQAVPVLMSGRDTLGLAETGSGKTLAYAWPMLVHCLAQREIASGEGPIALVLAPTRELVIQVYKSVKKFAKVSGMSVCPVYGGVSKWEQTKELRKGHEVLVATPGRLIDLIKGKSTNLRRVTFCVLDEADTMLDLGFEAQVRSVLAGIRPDRQTVLFTATLKRKLQALVTQALHNPVTITAGLQVSAGGGGGGLQGGHSGRAGIGSAVPGGGSGRGTRMVRSTEHIRQHAFVLESDAHKWPWLATYLPHMAQAGKVLLFVACKAAADTLAAQAQAALAHLPQFAPAPVAGAGSAPRSHGAFHAGQHVVAALHGDKLQGEREAVVSAFKRCSPDEWQRPSGPLPVRVLVATDIASRGMDIPGVAFVVHVDAPKNMDIHTQRSGRTGRMQAGGDAGDGAVRPGIVVTLLTAAQGWFAAELVRHLEACGWAVGGKGHAQEQAVATTAVQAATQVAAWAGPPCNVIPACLLRAAMTNAKFRAGRSRDGKRLAGDEASALASTQAFLASLAGGPAALQPPPLPPSVGQRKDGSFAPATAGKNSSGVSHRAIAAASAAGGGLGYATAVAGGTSALSGGGARKRSRFGAPMAPLGGETSDDTGQEQGVFAHRRSLTAGLKAAAAAQLQASFVKAGTEHAPREEGGLALPLTAQQMEEARAKRPGAARAVPPPTPAAAGSLGLPPPPPVPEGGASAEPPPSGGVGAPDPPEPAPKRSRWAPAPAPPTSSSAAVDASTLHVQSSTPSTGGGGTMTPAQAAAVAAAALREAPAPTLTPAAAAQLAAAKATGAESALGDFGGGGFYVKGVKY